MHRKFVLGETAGHAICRFKLGRRYQGPPGHAHGGIIATILDGAMGKVTALSHVLALTRTMNLANLTPWPLGTPLTRSRRRQSHNGREHLNLREITEHRG